jgi:hypothetical protein
MIEERRHDTESTRTSLHQLVSEIHADTKEMKTALFGPEGQPAMGFVQQTNDRLNTLEHRMWGAVVGTLSALVASAYHWVIKKS